MRRLFLALLLLAMTMPRRGATPMPSSDVILRLHRGGIDARLVLPIIELRLGWQKPLPMDAAQTIRQYGPDLKGYVLQHVQPVAPDGRPWAVTVRSLTPIAAPAPNPFVASSPDVAGGPDDDAAAGRARRPADLPLRRHLPPADHPHGHRLHRERLAQRRGRRPARPAGDACGTRNPRSSSTAPAGAGSAASRRSSAWGRGTSPRARTTCCSCWRCCCRRRSWRPGGGGAATRGAGRRCGGSSRSSRRSRSATRSRCSWGRSGAVRLPEPLIESAIALSIFVSAVHALVPIFRGREVFIAGGFGLVHGLAFAATLTEFGFDPLTMASSVLAFNLGIEAVQLARHPRDHALADPAGRTRLYAPFRVAGACLTGRRRPGLDGGARARLEQPGRPLVERAAAHALWIVAGLAILSVAAALRVAERLHGSRRRRLHVFFRFARHNHGSCRR